MTPECSDSAISRVSGTRVTNSPVTLSQSTTPPTCPPPTVLADHDVMTPGAGAETGHVEAGEEEELGDALSGQQVTSGTLDLPVIYSSNPGPSEEVDALTAKTAFSGKMVSTKHWIN